MIFPSEVAPVIAAGRQRMMPRDHNEPLPSSMNSRSNRVHDFIIGVCWAAGGRVLRFRSLMQPPLGVEQDEPNAIRNIDGTEKSPELVITNTRDPGNPEMTSIDKFIGTEFRSRYMNPTWIEGMKKEGYAGAGEMRSFVEYLWGWDATVTETVTDQMWKESFDVYVADKHNLGMKEFFEQKSPYAYQDITARMLETVRKGSRRRLANEHAGFSIDHGFAGAALAVGDNRGTASLRFDGYHPEILCSGQKHRRGLTVKVANVLV